MTKITTGYSIPKDIKDWLSALAEKEGRSASGMLTVILRKVMEDDKRCV